MTPQANIGLQRHEGHESADRFGRRGDIPEPFEREQALIFGFVLAVIVFVTIL